MKRSAILMIPMEWFVTGSNWVLFPELLDVTAQKKVLCQYGCSEYALQWLQNWTKDFQYDAMMYRFVSEQDETELYITEPGCRAMFIDLDILNQRCENTFKLYEINPKLSILTNPSKILKVDFSKGRRISRI